MKKKLPLDVIKGFNPKFGNSIEFERAPNKDIICIFRDKDVTSDFYFVIKQFNEKTNKFLVEYKPANQGTISSTANWYSTDELNHNFPLWVKIIDEYNSTETIFDDPILQTYQDEFLNEIKLEDDDSDKKPFSTEIILRLDKHLEHIENKIEEYKSEENQNEIIEIKLLAQDLRKEITKKTKNQVVRKLVNIWAKISKQGTILIKEFLTEGGKQLVKETIKFLIGKGIELIN